MTYQNGWEKSHLWHICLYLALFVPNHFLVDNIFWQIFTQKSAGTNMNKHTWNGNYYVSFIYESISTAILWGKSVVFPPFLGSHHYFVLSKIHTNPKDRMEIPLLFHHLEFLWWLVESGRNNTSGNFHWKPDLTFCMLEYEKHPRNSSKLRPWSSLIINPKGRKKPEEIPLLFHHLKFLW
jgi:hypothetical protein